MGSVGKDEFSKTLEDKAEEAGVQVRYQKQDEHPTGETLTPSFPFPPLSLPPLPSPPFPEGPHSLPHLHVTGGACERNFICSSKKSLKEIIDM